MRFGLRARGTRLAFGGLVAAVLLSGCTSNETSDTQSTLAPRVKTDAELREELKALSCSGIDKSIAHLGLTVPENDVAYLVVGRKGNEATLEVYPGAHQSASVRVCGVGGKLTILAPLTGPVLVAGEGATIIREEGVPEPKYLRLEGGGTQKIVCTRDSAPKKELPACRSLMKDDRLLKRW